MSSKLVKKGTGILGVLGEQSEQKRMELLHPEHLAQRIRYEGNRPVFDPSFRAELVAVTLACVAVDAKQKGPWGALVGRTKSVIQIGPNLGRRRINLRYVDKMVRAFDECDAKLAEISEKIEREQQPELWDAIVNERLGTLRQDLVELFQAHRREWKAAGWFSS